VAASLPREYLTIQCAAIGETSRQFTLTTPAPRLGALIAELERKVGSGK
jgi:hypothetical protein